MENNMTELSVFYAIDLSSSMVNSLDLVNHSIEEYNELLNDLAQSNNLSLKIAMMTYTNLCDWLTPHGPEEDFAFDYFDKAYNNANIKDALEELNNKLSDNTFFNYLSDKKFPIIIIMTSENIKNSKNNLFGKICKNIVWKNAVKIIFSFEDNQNKSNTYFISNNCSEFIDIKDTIFLINFVKAKLGDSDALYWLGNLYREGKIVKFNINKYLKYLKLSAEKGNSNAQYEMGIIYRDGKSITQNNEEAFKYFKLSAEQGNINAQFCLAYCYSDGIGVKQNMKEAFKYFKLSADNGNPVAQYCLGIMYKNGMAVNLDLNKAFNYFKLSADQGNADSQYQLGRLYYSGEVVAQDYKVAGKYFKLSADQGNADAKLALDSLRLRHSN